MTTLKEMYETATPLIDQILTETTKRTDSHGWIVGQFKDGNLSYGLKWDMKKVHAVAMDKNRNPDFTGPILKFRDLGHLSWWVDNECQVGPAPEVVGKLEVEEAG